jgi:hypothetical protein
MFRNIRYPLTSSRASLQTSGRYVLKSFCSNGDPAITVAIRSVQGALAVGYSRLDRCHERTLTKRPPTLLPVRIRASGVANPSNSSIFEIETYEFADVTNMLWMK